MVPPVEKTMRAFERVRLAVHRVQYRGREHYECPVCGYRGPFRDLNADTGLRKNALCPKCGALERHRLQFLVFDAVFGALDTQRMRLLHFAPEAMFRPILAKRFGRYETADLAMRDVDH